MHSARKVAIFNSQLVGVGGAERLVFEEAAALAVRGWSTNVLTLRFDPLVRFGAAYAQDVEVLPIPRLWNPLGKLGRFVGSQFSLFRWLRRSRPAIVIAFSATDCALLWLPAKLTGTRYVAHINGTIFWFPTDRTKYALVHRAGFQRILAKSPFSRDFVPSARPSMSPALRLKSELSALLHWVGVRGARRRITFSRRMAWEVAQLYGVPAEELKGAFHASTLTRTPAGDQLARFRINGGPVVLNVNRLESRKRVELAIRAFAEVATSRPDVVLVIGGRGPDESRLGSLVTELGLAERVFFAGFIPEDELLDWLAACEVFLHPNWADFAIAPYEALAVGRKVVWSSEMESDDDLTASGLVYAANPEVAPMAEQLEAALAAPSPSREARSSLAAYSWEHYFDRLSTIVAGEASSQ